jgi:hypothetical protein
MYFRSVSDSTSHRLWDQKGFVAGRNISENNRMIDDIIEFVDNEDEEGVIIFVDQQKAFDRMEWGFTGCPSQSGSLIPCISGVFRIAQAIGSA